MVILIDPPRWPAHGTTFSHLVSDASTDELHAFAEQAGIDRRAFELDHYDVPARRHDELVRLGAVPVPGTELVRRLRAAGLRVPARRRPDRVRGVLRTRWEQTLAGAPEVGAELLERWSEPPRRYHDVTHLLAVLEALEVLCAPGGPARAVRLAAWFHDSVYEGAATDEARSAELTGRLLAGRVPPAEVVEVQRLVLVTTDHRPAPGDVDGALLSDADLAVLGSAPGDYDRYVRAVRADYAHVDDARWRTGRTQVLSTLLASPPLFRTARGRQRWEDSAVANLRAELGALNEPLG